MLQALEVFVPSNIVMKQAAFHVNQYSAIELPKVVLTYVNIKSTMGIVPRPANDQCVCVILVLSMFCLIFILY